MKLIKSLDRDYLFCSDLGLFLQRMPSLFFYEGWKLIDRSVILQWRNSFAEILQEKKAMSKPSELSNIIFGDNLNQHS